jgi:hypothetical protein
LKTTRAIKTIRAHKKNTNQKTKNNNKIRQPTPPNKSGNTSKTEEELIVLFPACQVRVSKV